MRKTLLYLLICSLIPIIGFGQEVNEIWLSGAPPDGLQGKVRKSGMQHFYTYRNRGKEKLLLWPRSGESLTAKNYISSTVDSVQVIIKDAKKQTLKGGLLESDLGWHIEYGFDSEGFHNIFMIIRHQNKDTNFVHIARQERMSHKCRSGHKNVMVQMAPISYPKIAPLELLRQRQPYENFHGILESGMNIQFELLFKGQPIPSHPVRITLQSGWETKIYSDNNGIVSFQIPNDYFSKLKELEKDKTHRFLIQTNYDEIQVAVDSTNSVTRYSTKMEFDYIPSKTLYMSYVWPWILFIVTLISISVAIIMIRRKRQKYLY